MAHENFIDVARAEGYTVRFQGMGMGYIEMRGLKLTETMDLYKLYPIMAQIGVAIINDTIRTEEF